MNTIDAIMARKSVRGYLAKPVEDEKLNTVLAAGNKTAHAGPLFMTVIRNRAIIDDIDARARAAVEASDNEFLKSRFAIPGYSCTYGAPILIILSAPAEGNGKANAAGAAANMGVAAVELGLGSCVLGSVLMAFGADPELAGRVGIPQGNVPQFGFILGYEGPSAIPPRTGNELRDNINFVD